MNLKQCTLATKESMERALNEAEEKAHRNLARYKFMNFGYWAAIWVHLNQVGNFHRPNPFSPYVELARNKTKGVNNAHKMESGPGD